MSCEQITLRFYYFRNKLNVFKIVSCQVTTVKQQNSNFLFKLTNFTEHNLIAAYEHLGKQNNKIVAIC